MFLGTTARRVVSRKRLSDFWGKPENLLLSLTFVMSFMFATWQVLLNNFVIERANFTGVEIGVLQSLREVPGFLAFTAVFVLLIIREQFFALISVAIMALGVALTGFFPFATGLYLTTVVMSIGFHYFETINKSLTLQWLSKEHAPHFMGRALSVKAIASLSAYGLIFVAMDTLGVEYKWMYLLAGVGGLCALSVIVVKFKNFNPHVDQHKKLLLRKRYWLFYALVFFSGARRQIFVVFAGFLMVEKFHYSVGEISALFIINYVFNFFFAARIGKLIGVIGERRALIIEYSALILIFVGYAFVESATVAAGLYVIDHLFFAFAIAVSTYFQKIADPADMAATASVSFTINHIAAVVIPALLGIVWIISHGTVFLMGAVFAVFSLILAFNIPLKPSLNNEVLVGRVAP
ncbi:MFS transporter [Teredinibacter purpureus]|uniref:MFS transporter n=1 Tax=Teredinibacter purpureus TaxID=2731756 RepID=UPI0005F81100|nr:MFS transporter [Teredinibacter purpureus]